MSDRQGAPSRPPRFDERSRAWGPSLVDATFVLWAFVAAFGFQHRLLNGDGDALWHLRLGEWMLRHHAILRVHDFSHTAPAGSFLPMEWLSQLLLAGAYELGGFPGLVVLSSVLIALAATLTVRFMQRRGVDAALSFALGAAAAVFTSPHWMARPHLFTFVAVPVLLALLMPVSGRLRPLWFAPVFLLWANLHGGFLFGLGLIGVFLVADAYGWWTTRSAASGRMLRDRSAALGVSGLACLVNPVGPRLFTRISTHMGDTVMLANTQEFLSPDFHQANGRILLFAVLAIFCLFAVRSRRPKPVILLTCIVMTALAFQTQRHMTLFGLVVFPLLGLEFDADWRRIGRLAQVRENIARDDALARRGVWAAAATLLLLALAGAGGRLGRLHLLPQAVDPGVFPLGNVAAARNAHLAGNLLNDFDWGGYVLFAWPEQRVFIDGATAYYGPVVMNDYLTATELRPGWRDVLQRRRISMVLMRPGTPLAEELRRTPGWRVWREDGTSVLLVREGAPGGTPRGGPGSVGRA